MIPILKSIHMPKNTSNGLDFLYHRADIDPLIYG